MTTTTSTPETELDPNLSVDAGPREEESAGFLEEAHFDEMEQRAQEIDARVRSFVSRHPVPSLAIAAAAGFLFGRIASRIL